MVKIVTFIMINLLLISFLEHHIACSEIQYACVCPGWKDNIISFNPYLC